MLLSHRISFTTLLLLLLGGLLLPIQRVRHHAVHGQCADFAPPLIIQGKNFYNSVTREYFPVRGVNYYPRPNTGSLAQTNSIDFATEAKRPIWERDVEFFQQLNINLVRLYAVEPGQNHDGFMCALKAAGIYVMVGLAADCENCAITTDPSPACYPVELKERGQFIISEFARYDNVLGFDAGNEISLSSGSVYVNGACQKQFIRDMRAYIQSCSATIRPIPIGLAIADIERFDTFCVRRAAASIS
jgi:1,3-beta-glucanosyltransferase GAS5